MTTEVIKNVYRHRCDVCRTLIPIGNEGRKFRDTITGETLDVCTLTCADKEWNRRYQLRLPAPSSNTGVVFPKKAKNAR